MHAPRRAGPKVQEFRGFSFPRSLGHADKLPADDAEIKAVDRVVSAGAGGGGAGRGRARTCMMRWLLVRRCTSLAAAYSATAASPGSGPSTSVSSVPCRVLHFGIE